jgi:hypothetical protein
MNKIIKGTKLNVYNYLKETPLARERVNKYKAITHLVQRRYDNASKIPKEELVHWIKLAIKYDRDLRHITKTYIHLRGSDYNNKKKLTNRALTEYGYKI